MTAWNAAHQASLSFTISQSLLKLMSMESVILSNYFILCCPLLLSPPIFPSIRVFSNDSALCIRWPKYWSFSFSISPPNVYSGLISFRIDWFDLHAVQGTLKSLFQNHSSKVSVLQCSALFPESSHPSALTLISPSHRTSLPQSQVGLMTPCFLLGAYIPSPLSNVVTNRIMFMFSCLFHLADFSAGL